MHTKDLSDQACIHNPKFHDSQNVLVPVGTMFSRLNL